MPDRACFVFPVYEFAARALVEPVFVDRARARFQSLPCARIDRPIGLRNARDAVPVAGSIIAPAAEAIIVAAPSDHLLVLNGRVVELIVDTDVSLHVF